MLVGNSKYKYGPRSYWVIEAFYAVDGYESIVGKNIIILLYILLLINKPFLTSDNSKPISNKIFISFNLKLKPVERTSILFFIIKRSVSIQNIFHIKKFIIAFKLS